MATRPPAPFGRDHNQAQLPIIAMTAHAMQTEIQRCLDVGMNDCVTKPIDPEKLKSVLMRWIKTQFDSPQSEICTDALIQSQYGVLPYLKQFPASMCRRP